MTQWLEMSRMERAERLEKLSELGDEASQSQLRRELLRRGVSTAFNHDFVQEVRREYGAQLSEYEESRHGVQDELLKVLEGKRSRVVRVPPRSQPRHRFSSFLGELYDDYRRNELDIDLRDLLDFDIACLHDRGLLSFPRGSRGCSLSTCRKRGMVKVRFDGRSDDHHHSRVSRWVVGFHAMRTLRPELSERIAIAQFLACIEENGTSHHTTTAWMYSQGFDKIIEFPRHQGGIS